MNGKTKDAPDVVEQGVLSPLQSVILQIFRLGAWGTAAVAMLHIMFAP